MAQKKTIIWIDSEPMFSRAYIDELMENGYDVIKVTAIECLNQALECAGDISLFIMDYAMREKVLSFDNKINYRDLVDCLNKYKYKDVPKVVFTCYDFTVENRDDVTFLDRTHFLSDEFVDKVNEIINDDR